MEEDEKVNKMIDDIVYNLRVWELEGRARPLFIAETLKDNNTVSIDPSDYYRCGYKLDSDFKPEYVLYRRKSAVYRS